MQVYTSKRREVSLTQMQKLAFETSMNTTILTSNEILKRVTLKRSIISQFFSEFLSRLQHLREEAL